MGKTIEEAAVTHANNTHPNHPLENEAARQGFIDGAYYSLSHQWRSVQDELPEDDSYVITRSKGNHYSVAQFSKGKFINAIQVTHFMYIPSLNPEQR